MFGVKASFNAEVSFTHNIAEYGGGMTTLQAICFRYGKTDSVLEAMRMALCLVAVSCGSSDLSRCVVSGIIPGQ